MKQQFGGGSHGNEIHDNPGQFIVHDSDYGSCGRRLTRLKERPGDLIVFLAVGEGEGGGVAALGGAGAAGEGVVCVSGGGDGAVGEREGDLRDFFAALARKADTNEALAVGEDDAVVMVMPGVPLVTLHHRELDAVDELPPQISCNE